MNFQKSNNHKAIRHLAWSSLKKSRLRNILSGIIISLSAAMLVACSVFGYNMMQNLKSATTYHAAIADATEAILTQLTGSSDVQKVGVTVFAASAHDADASLSLQYMDAAAMELSGFNLVDGAMPEQTNEILISELFAQNKSLSIGSSYSADCLNATTKETTKQNFTVCGLFLASDGYENNQNANIILSKAFVEKDGSNLSMMAFFQLSNAEKLSEQEQIEKAMEVGRASGAPEDSININAGYINGINMTPETPFVIAGIAVFILAACILVIYSIFYVAVVGRVREYGQLRTIGMTQKQIKKIVSLETTLLALVFIPLGVVIGLVLAYFIMPNAWNLISDLLIAVLMGIIIFLTVHLAVRKPMKLAAAVSPIEAIRYSGLAADSRPAKKSARHITPRYLGWMTLCRNRKRTVLTMLSLSFSGILFVASVGFLSSFDPVKRADQTFPFGGEYQVAFNGELYSPTTDFNDLQTINLFSDDLKAKIESVPHVTDVKVNQDILAEQDDGNRISFAALQNQPTDSLSKSLVSGSLDENVLKNPTSLVINEARYYKVLGQIPKIGDTFETTLLDGDKRIPYSFTVVAVINDKKSPLILGLDETVFSSLIQANSRTGFEILTDNGYSEETQQQLLSAIDNKHELSLSSKNALIKEMKDAFNLMTMAAYILTGFIALFGLVNLFNTTITSFMARRLEIASLQAMGLTTRQLRQMLRAEGLFYSGISLLLSLSVGSVLAYLICNIAVNSGLDFASFQFPLVPILIFTGVLALVQVVLSTITSKLLGKKSLTDRLREVEC